VKRVGGVSYRGFMALGIGLVFVWLAVRPDLFNKAPPLFLRAIMFVSGAVLAYGGIVSIRFFWKRRNLVRSNIPVDAEICVLLDDDPDRSTETVHVRVNGRCQALCVDRSGAARKYVDGTVRRGDVWLDDNGTVHAIAISGEHFKPLRGGIPVDRFGAS
jgi:hypothetical protein